MRVLIADDLELLRDALRSYLEAETGFVVETVADLPQALDRIAAAEAAALPFDLVVLDYGMPGMDGYRGLEQAIAASAGRPVALMSGIAPPGVAEKVLSRMASDSLAKFQPAQVSARMPGRKNTM